MELGIWIEHITPDRKSEEVLMAKTFTLQLVCEQQNTNTYINLVVKNVTDYRLMIEMRHLIGVLDSYDVPSWKFPSDEFVLAGYETHTRRLLNIACLRYLKTGVGSEFFHIPLFGIRMVKTRIYEEITDDMIESVEKTVSETGSDDDI